MANTYVFRQNFDTSYQETLFRQPVYRALAREAIMPKLYDGQTLSRSYISRFSAGELGADGTYEPLSFTATAEVLTVNQKPEVSTTIVEWQRMLDDLRTDDSELPDQFASTMFNYIDARVLGAIIDGAGSNISDGDFGGTSGNGITVTTSNVQNIFTSAFRNLMLKNAMQGNYSPVKRFSGVKSMDGGERMPVAVIDAYTYAQLQLSLGSKYTAMGDRVTTNGYVDTLFGWNIFVSNNLRWSCDFAVTSSNLTTADTFTIGAVTFTGTTGTPTNPGDFKIEAAAVDTATNIKNMLNSPYTSISGKSVAFTRTSLTFDQNMVLRFIAAGALTSTSTVPITLDGQSNVIVSTTSATGTFTAAKQISHLVFGTSQMIDLAIVQTPTMTKRPVSGKLSNDLVMSALAGWKVFHEQSPRIVDVKVRTAAYTLAPAN